MIKILSGIIVGVSSALFAVYFVYLYIAGRQDGHSPMLLIPSVFLLAVGGYSFFKVIRIFLIQKQQNGTDALALEGVPAQSNTGDQAKILKRNNQLIEDYTKTEKTQDQLKMLQAAGAAENAS